MNRSANWRDIRAYTPAAWLVAVTFGLSVLLMLGCLVYLLTQANALFVQPQDGLDRLTSLVIIILNTTVPLALLTINAALLNGVLAKRIIALAAAALILPLEWMTGFVLGGNALTSILFNGQDLISDMPYHEVIQLCVLILFITLSFSVCGRQIYAVAHTKK